MPKLPTVELHSAFFWICDDCGKDNFVRALPVSREQIEADAEDLGDDLLQYEWVQKPDEVACAHCGLKFATENP